jgi:hypothetical protein
MVDSSENILEAKNVYKEHINVSLFMCYIPLVIIFPSFFVSEIFYDKQTFGYEHSRLQFLKLLHVI